ncbi:sporulation protein [Bacillus sp. PAMC26568]|nr:sporulation protein [Bacillus sp. PAMC26568]
MSFFNKILSSVGIGAAKVDARLSSDKISLGEELKGIIHVQGGNIEQQIDEIYLSLQTTYVKESDDKKYEQAATITKVKINEPFVIMANEIKEIPFSFPLPLDTPISLGSSKVWLETGLDIKGAVDPSDKDYLEVVPPALVQTIFAALRDLGFNLRKVENEAAPYHLRKRLPFVQEFEFYPTGGQFRGKLDELEVVISNISNHGVELLLEVDRRARGLGGFLSEALEMDESMVKVTFTQGDQASISRTLENVIQRYS